MKALKKMDEKKIQVDIAQPEAGMALFIHLLSELDQSTRTNDKLDALTRYFNIAPPKDKVWVIALFTGRRPRRTLSTKQLQEWCMEVTGFPPWLFQESYQTVGDLAETIALLIAQRDPLVSDSSEKAMKLSLSYYLESIQQLSSQTESAKKSFILNCWKELDRNGRFILNKLITGGFRMGVSSQMVVNALARVQNREPASISHQISGKWDPSTTDFDELLNPDQIYLDASRPYPFFLAYGLETTPKELGDPADWQAEWKWDGIRGQIIKRNDELYVWSRGEELMTDKFPEYFPLRDLLPNGLVLDGEILPVRNGKPLPFSLLQTRIGRKNISRKHLTEAPVGFYAYDLLEWKGEDSRERNLEERRILLKRITDELRSPVLELSPVVAFNDWDALARIRETARENGSEGIMLKRLGSVYQTGRKRGDWWKWKIDPLTIDAVMIYAQKGHGRRGDLYTDYTFAVRDGDRLVSFAKAYSGLTDAEIREVDQFVKKNSIERFGPVRTVKAELVFELAFEGIAESKRHKSGVALRFPRINRWRKDKRPDEINTLDDLKKMLSLYGNKTS